MLPKYIQTLIKQSNLYAFSLAIFSSYRHVKKNVMRYMYYPHFINKYINGSEPYN